MDKSTDLEICKRIAEIEGVDIVHSKTFDIQRIAIKKHYYSNKLHESSARNIAIETEYFKHNTYNPLTDDALCFQLMVKYKIQIQHENPDYSCAQCEHDVVRFNAGDNPSRAICLAIISAHKERNNG